MSNNPYRNDPYAAPVAAYLHAIGSDAGVSLGRDTPTEVIDLRLRAIDDEVSSLFEAINHRDSELTARELAEVLWSVFAAAVTFGVPIDDVFSAVARSNMSRIDPSTGSPYEVVGGKVRKGPEFHDPTAEIAEIMRTRMP